MIGAERFGPEFQRVLVRACVDDHALRALVSDFTGRGQLTFTDPSAMWAWKVISQTDRPSMLMLQTESRALGTAHPLDMKGVGQILNMGDVRELEYVSEQIVEWARMQVFLQGMAAAHEDWTSGKTEDAYDKVRSFISDMDRIKIQEKDRGWFFEEFEERQMRRQTMSRSDRNFPTGIEDIDHRMYGGLSPGEVGAWMAYSGIGKSFALPHCGRMAIMGFNKVLHFPLEGLRSQVEDRYEAGFTQELYRNVRMGEFDSAKLARIQWEYQSYYRNSLVIRSFGEIDDWSVRLDHMWGEIQELKADHGWVPDLIVVDYGDLIDGPGDGPREKQMNAFRGLKSLATRTSVNRYGMGVWTATQAQRPQEGADEKEHILWPRSVADAYEKVRILDALLSINRTVEEAEDGIARVALGKYRDNKDKVVVTVYTDYDRGSFVGAS